MKSRMAAGVVLAALTLTLAVAAPTAAVQCDTAKPECAGSTGQPVTAPSVKDVLYEKAPPAPVGRDSVPGVPNLSVGEADAARAGGGSGRGGGGGAGTGGGDRTTGPDLGTMVNPSPMSNLPRRQLLTVRKDGINRLMELSDVAVTRMEYSETPDGTVATSVTYYFDQVLEGRTRILQAIFATTAGDFSSCSFISDWGVNCALRGGVLVSGRDRDDPPAPWRLLLPPTSAPGSGRAIPLCAGGTFDGGPGVETVIGLDDVYCEASAATTPVGLRLVASSADASASVAAVDPTTGEVHYSATAEAEGTYTVLTLTAVSAFDGIESWPFTVVVRNHYVPQAQDGPVVDAIRGVDEVVPLDRLFTDQDIDRWSAYTHDRLIGEVVSDGAYGHASFDASGDLRYHPIDAVEGSVTDRVTVTATDRYGIRSRPVTIEFTITDVMPSCSNGTIDAVAGQTVTIDVDCRVDGPAGYHPVRNVVYSVAGAPTEGVLSEIDPDIGLMTYTPDASQVGPVVIRFSGDNNGVSRSAEFIVNVLPAS